MASTTTTEFPKIGEDIASHVMNLSGNRSPYTTLEAKKTMGRGASPTGSKGGVKGRKLINEAHGPACHVQATLYQANAAAAQDVTRNVKIVPSSIGNRDFWAKRSYGQGA